MAEETRTIKIYERTHPPLRLLAAMTGETMMDLIDRLVKEEEQRIDKGKTGGNLRSLRPGHTED